MEFDKGSNFPGLYSADNRRQNDSDFSDDNTDRSSKKDLLIGKRKDKKDKGYATLEGESSPEEDLDTKSPSKARKSNPFKFSSRKEKREKSRDKDSKEKDVEKEKKKEKEKEKEKEKSKSKHKEKKKTKHAELDIAEELPIFGVPLAVSVERNPCHDGIRIPLVIRHCIDYIENHGLTMEGVYKVTGVKSRVHHAYNLYNRRQVVSNSDFDVTVATSLLKQFLRLLPDPVFTKDLTEKFENPNVTKDVENLKKLTAKLPECNRHLLSWLFTHFQHVTQHGKQNKMNASLLGAVFCPSLQISPRLFNTLVAYADEIFPHTVLKMYVPPLRCISPTILQTVEELNEELKKQESLLSLIHFEMNAGFVNKDKEDELWGVQRNITQLKRKIKSLEKEKRRLSTEVQEQIISKPETVNKDVQAVSEEVTLKASSTKFGADDRMIENLEYTGKMESTESAERDANQEQMESDDDEMLIQYERMELLQLAKELQDQIKEEKARIEKLKAELVVASSKCTSSTSVTEEEDAEVKNELLQAQKNNLLKNIMDEKETILDLKIEIRMLEMKKQIELTRRFLSL